MLVGGTKPDKIRIGSKATIDEDTFEVVEKFICPGFLLMADYIVSRAWNLKRHFLVSKAFYPHMFSFSSKLLSL